MCATAPLILWNLTVSLQSVFLYYPFTLLIGPPPPSTVQRGTRFMTYTAPHSWNTHTHTHCTHTHTHTHTHIHIPVHTNTFRIHQFHYLILQNPLIFITRFHTVYHIDTSISNNSFTHIPYSQLIFYWSHIRIQRLLHTHIHTHIRTPWFYQTHTSDSTWRISSPADGTSFQPRTSTGVAGGASCRGLPWSSNIPLTWKSHTLAIK